MYNITEHLFFSQNIFYKFVFLSLLYAAMLNIKKVVTIIKKIIKYIKMQLTTFLALV